ncbi:hypothetical protein MNBD_GAMMA03-1883 [hydrothermal vent metagenome]|uniref:TraB/GumN family protein n=1 Tax=hydrothermal vent metagenome TaxID=652676 RepID=A0A3B0W892_9ZZZZ
MKFPLLLSLLLVSLTAFAQAPDVTPVTEADKTKFLRIKSDTKNTPVALQLANARYVPISGIPADMYVDLISAVHIADKSYYENLNTLFQTYDVVLYELVAEEGTKISNENTGDGKSMLSILQHGMKNVLGLSFQLDEIDYSPNNFVHADISPTDFKNSMNEKGESFFSMFMRMWLVSLQQQATNPNAVNDIDLLVALFSGNRERDLKVIAAKQFMDMDPIMNAIEGDSGSTIITARNLKALKVLRREIEKGHKTFAIFYGAAHMPEMATVLMQEFKFKPDQVNWVDAWDLR